MADGRVLVFDCFSGIAGDMALAALIDAGAPLEAIREGLARLDLPPFEILAREVQRGGMRALHLSVAVGQERVFQPGEMRERIRAARLGARVEMRALAAVDVLEAGERLAHGTEEADFHEVGGVDALIDICGVMLALEALGVERAVCPVVTVGAGTIAKSAHGPIAAAPGPAAAHILESAGFALRFVEAGHELVTPTGAAILGAVAAPGAATIVPERHGAGAGAFDPPGRPNALRVFLGLGPGATGDGLRERQVVLLEANIDDLAPSLLAHARDRLLEEGALDAWTEPIGMKKGRAATKLCALVPLGEEERFARMFLRETTTIGVRTAVYRRFEAERKAETFVSSLGAVHIKTASVGGVLRQMPEFEDVKQLAASLGLAAVEVQRMVEAELAARGRGL